MSKSDRKSNKTTIETELSKEKLRMLAGHGSTPFTKALALVLLYGKKEELDRLKQLVKESGG
jgi:hypothetical protein